MNTNPNAVKILCYGDSNTWGQQPDKSGRFAAHIRWPGVLQSELGNDYYVIEEGLSSRTTDLEYTKKPGRNGKTYLQPCLGSHSPLDIVIVMLGTNDLKIEFDRSAKEIANALAGLVDIIRNDAKNSTGTSPQVILISPITVDDTAPRFAEIYTGYYDQVSTIKSRELSSAIKEVAERNDCYFIDAASVAHAGEDGLHFAKSSHPELGKAIAQEIKKIGQ